MKNKFLRRLIAISIIFSATVTLISEKASAEWINNYGVWSYLEGYSYATGWKQIDGIWYFFNDFGQMMTGWIQSGDEWYYTDLSGAMQTGVIQIEGKIHLFSSNGAMQTGKCLINGTLYNFDDKGVFIGTDAPTPDKAFDYYGNSTIPYTLNQIINKDASMSSDIPSDGTEEVTQYKVKFKDPEAEDDDELLKTRTVDEDTVITLYKPAKSGYTFVEWNTKADGDGTSYDYDDTIKVDKNITLYAQWKEADSSEEDSTDTIEITSITVSGANGLTKIATKGGSLQMTKKVSPGDATTQTVTWSVINGTGEATISSTGKLTAVSNGTVVVRATANDDSKAYGEITITISNQ